MVSSRALLRPVPSCPANGRLRMLADALQDAGCDNDDILDPHATHVRGCWVVDMVLGKE